MKDPIQNKVVEVTSVIAKRWDWNKFIHAHAYYAFMIFSLVLFFLTVVQAVYTQVVSKNFTLAALYYFIAAIFVVITKRSYRRGQFHYKY